MTSDVMTLTELWHSGKYKELKAKISDTRSLKYTIHNFVALKPDIANKYITKKPDGRRKTVIISNLENMIREFNENYGIRTKEVVDQWSSSAIDCYEHKGECATCFYNNAFSELHNKCHMKETVKSFLETFGEPVIKTVDVEQELLK